SACRSSSLLVSYVFYFIYVRHFLFFFFSFFFFNDTSTTEIYTLSLHDALPIYPRFFIHSSSLLTYLISGKRSSLPDPSCRGVSVDRKSTRLNSSHVKISYAVFCLKKKKKDNNFIDKEKYYIMQ